MKVYRLVEDHPKIWACKNIIGIESIYSIFYKIETYFVAYYFVHGNIPSLQQALFACNMTTNYPAIWIDNLLIHFDERKKPRKDSGAELFEFYFLQKEEVTDKYIDYLDGYFNKDKIKEIKKLTTEYSHSYLCHKYMDFDWFVNSEKNKKIIEPNYENI